MHAHTHACTHARTHTGYLRPEAKFAGFPLLLAAIKQDLADAKACLDQVPKP
jgi:FAD synthase